MGQAMGRRGLSAQAGNEGGTPRERGIQALLQSAGSGHSPPALPPPRHVKCQLVSGKE
jgi:hypothetical protein